MDCENKEKAIGELKDEIEVVLSIKDDITQDEINNFKEEFSMFTEKEIRQEISKLTQNEKYIEEYSENTNPCKQDEIENNMEEIDDVKEYKIGEKSESKEQENINLGDTIRIDRDKINEAILKFKSEEVANEEIHKENIEISDAILISAIKDVEENLSVNKTKVEDEKNYDIDDDIKIKEVKKPEKVSYEAKEVEDIEPGRLPENIRVIRGEVKYNQLSIDWDWPYGVKKTLILYRNDKFPTKPDDSSAVKIIVEKNYGETIGQFTIHKIKEENYYFCVFPIIEDNGEINYLEGKKRLIVSKAPSEISYELKVKRKLFYGIKAVSIIFSTSSEEVNMPPTVLIAKKGNMPVFKSDGEEIYKFDYIKIGKHETVEVEIPINIIKKNTYIKLFLEDERNSSMFRIIPPAKRELYFK